MQHNAWEAPCACGGSFRIPAGVYDRDPDGQLTFARPLVDADPEAGAPTSFSLAFARRGDAQAIAAALRRLGRSNLTADQAADALEEIAPAFSWLARWLRARKDELNKNQVSIALAVAGILLSLYALTRPAVLSEQQMDELVDRVSSSQLSQQPTEDEIESAVRRELDKARIEDEARKRADDDGHPTTRCR